MPSALVSLSLLSPTLLTMNSETRNKLDKICVFEYYSRQNIGGYVSLKVIDLFCGCGGLSAGLREAGFEILAGIDVESNYLQSFTENFKEAKSINTNISELDPNMLMNELGLQKGELDLLVGGPPCQGFSKNVPKSQRSLNSENNKLVNEFLYYCEQINPKWILMENVAEMRNGFEQHYTQEIMNRLTKAGYKIIHDVFNSVDFGVPQNRRRAFFIARRDGLQPITPKPTHFKATDGTSLDITNTYISVWDAISDLKPLKQGEGSSPDEYVCKPKNTYQSYMRDKCKVVYNHIAKSMSKKQYERMSYLKPGQGIKDLPPELRPKGGYSGAYGRLTKDMIMPTITRWVFHFGSGRWGHPVDLRLITIREAARLHSFKDSFIFKGSYNDQAGQIGNAVPPLLAKAMGESLINTKKS